MNDHCPHRDSHRWRLGGHAWHSRAGLCANLQPRHRQAGLLHLFGRRRHRQGRGRRRPESARQARSAAPAPMCRASAAGEQQFGLANELETHYAVTGTAIYKGKPQPDLRVVAVLTPLYSVFFVAKDLPIKTIADLKGKRVPTDYASQRVLDILTQGYARQWRPLLHRRAEGAGAERGRRRQRIRAGQGRRVHVRARRRQSRGSQRQGGGARAAGRSLAGSDGPLAKFIPVAYATQVKPARAAPASTSRPGSMPMIIWC